MPRPAGKILPAIIVFVVAAAVVLLIGRSDAAEQPQAKNVILLIADGCSTDQYTLARWYHGKPLPTDGILVGAVRTYAADSVITDSAPAASAYATGVRTTSKGLSIGPGPKTLSSVPKPPADLQYRPLATVLEGARLQGKATGVVVTCRVTHATPAAFVAHTPLRDREEDIMSQMAHQNVDLVFGGGRDWLLPKSAGGKRADGQDLLETLKAHGYQIIGTRSDLAGLKPGRVFGLFAKDHMAPEIDRPQSSPSQPTLEEMTRKAIEMLSQRPEGFFLMVEGSQVDWACHANDPAHMLSDLLMFERTVQAALDFAAKDGQTLVISLSDHNTGGMTIGNASSRGSSTQMPASHLLDPLRPMKVSAPALWKNLGNDKTPANVRRVVQEGWGMAITDADAKAILAVTKRDKSSPQNAFGEVLCPKYTVIGWTTHSHCGGDVPLFAYGPGRPAGLLEGPEIGRHIARALGLDLQKINERLFVDAKGAFADGKVTLDTSDKQNPVVQIELGGRIAKPSNTGGKIARLPVNRNLLLMDGKTIELEGVVVYAPDTGKAYVPQQAVRLIRGSD
jgi:alkaline phosphatase